MDCRSLKYVLLNRKSDVSGVTFEGGGFCGSVRWVPNRLKRFLKELAIYKGDLDEFKRNRKAGEGVGV